ncbi:MAG: energy-coupling factor transporter ATPase [Clostridia bacterium]|jgi:energy-coupling factor transport system ATP-binding protein|nr:energy-coupling factor transporter ATPase [Clostridia bacterium]
MKAIEIKNVTFNYENSKIPVIKDLSLSVDKGEFLCILGENGSGKSTLSRLINGLLLPSQGDVLVFGLNTRDKAKTYEIRKSVGMVFQNPDNQMIATIVEDDIAFGPENLGVPSDEIGKRIDFALKSVNMERYKKVAGQKLSGGQKQRIAIAGALAVMPEILILDESTAMLDPLGREEVLSVIKDLNKSGMTVILITHYMDEALLADKVAVLSSGELKLLGTPTEVLSNPQIKNYGLDYPRPYYIAQKLKENGLPINANVFTKEDLAEELCKLFQKG